MRISPVLLLCLLTISSCAGRREFPITVAGAAAHQRAPVGSMKLTWLRDRALQDASHCRFGDPHCPDALRADSGARRFERNDEPKACDDITTTEVAGAATQPQMGGCAPDIPPAPDRQS